MNSILYFLIATGLVLLWLNVIATLAICKGTTIEKSQRKYQITFVWLVPLIGSLIFLHLVLKHCPEEISTLLIPWPFKKIIKVRTIPANQNREDYDHGVYLAENSNGDYSSGADSGRSE